jgi:protein subunit release factor B
VLKPSGTLPPSTDDLERLARDCDVQPFKSSGPGGQKKNKTESSVRVRHRPTGIIRLGTESRSQRRNRAAALRRLWDELARRSRKRKARVATRPGAAAVERRLMEKRRTSARKQERRLSEE